MKGLNVLFALFAGLMLVRHGPRAIALLRGRGERDAGIVSIFNVLLAVAILAVAVKGLVGGLISP